MKKKILPIFACLIAVVMAFAIGTTTSGGVVYAERRRRNVYRDL